MADKASVQSISSLSTDGVTVVIAADSALTGWSNTSSYFSRQGGGGVLVCKTDEANGWIASSLYVL